MEINGNLKSEKVVFLYSCKSCNYHCRRKYDYNKHLLTRKHLLEINGNNIDENGNNGNEIVVNVFNCSCGKDFKTYSGFWKHQKKCYIAQETNNIIIDKITTPQPKDTNILNELHTVINENKELHTVIRDQQKHMDDKNNHNNFKELIVMMMKENKDFQLQMQKSFLDIIPHVKGDVNNSNNSNSTTNNQFNIQMFLNEHCKDAMNLTDFIQSLPITAETYDHTIEDGLTKSITKMMVNGLNQLDILQRPIHCTDASRKILYVKDDDIWEKDNELLHLLKGIQDLSVKQRVNIHKWQDANDGWDVKDDLQTKITMLVFHTMTDIENDEKETRKIISAISKNTYLSNDIKDEYKGVKV